MHLVLHGFDRCISGCVREEGVLAEAIFLVFLVNFLVIYAVNPFESCAIDGELVRRDLLEEL